MISTAQLKPESQFARPAAHLIASIRGALPGPTLIILGGIHGNELAGVLAADRVRLRMQERRAALRGEVVLLRGNTRALEQRVRYINADLTGNGRLRMFAPPSWNEALLKCRNSSNNANCVR